MMTKCDRYWYQLNKVYLIILFCTIPAALLFPVLSLIIPMIFLYGTCDKFIVFHAIGEKQDDSVRFIISMPFSRKHIFNTYIKGLTVTSLGYAFAVSLIRALLALTKLSKVFLWSNNINTGYDLFSYIAILLLCLFTTGYFLICLVNNYILSLKSIYLCISFFIVLPLLYVSQFSKAIIMFVTGFSNMKMGISYSLGDILRIGLPEKTASNCSVIIFVILILVVLCSLNFAISKEGKKFV